MQLSATLTGVCQAIYTNTWTQDGKQQRSTTVQVLAEQTDSDGQKRYSLTDIRYYWNGDTPPQAARNYAIGKPCSIPVQVVGDNLKFYPAK